MRRRSRVAVLPVALVLVNFSHGLKLVCLFLASRVWDVYTVWLLAHRKRRKKTLLRHTCTGDVKSHDLHSVNTSCMPLMNHWFTIWWLLFPKEIKSHTSQIIHSFAHRALLGPLNSVYVILNTVYSKIIGCILLCMYHYRLLKTYMCLKV